jgi:hypothetical protein
LDAVLTALGRKWVPPTSPGEPGFAHMRQSVYNCLACYPNRHRVLFKREGKQYFVTGKSPSSASTFWRDRELRREIPHLQAVEGPFIDFLAVTLQEPHYWDAFS